MSEFNGIDVSEWQGDIDFTSVRDDGIDAVYIRAGSGTSYEDPYFERNYDGASRAGLKTGFYYYVTARSAGQAEYQATFFSNLVSGKNYAFRLAMDFEDLSGLTDEEIDTISIAFLDKLRELGDSELLIYSDAFNAKETFGGELTEYPLWIAEYGVEAPSEDINWSEWVGWQYTDEGSVSGISGNVDRDIFKTGAERSSSTSITSGDLPASRKDIIYYIVKRGNTLTSIAKLYHTTVEALVEENNIENPNLIYTGERLKIPVVNDSQAVTVLGSHTVAKGDTLYAISKRYNTTVNKLAKYNSISNPNLIFPGQIIKIIL